MLAVRDVQTLTGKGEAAIVGYINTANGAAVFRAYHGGEKDVGPLAHLSGRELDAGKPDTFARQLAALATPPSTERVPVPVPPERPEIKPAPPAAPQSLPTKEPPPPPPAAQPVVGKAQFWPRSRVADNGDLALLEGRRAAKLAEVKGRTDAELLADRAATKTRIAVLVAEDNLAGAKPYEQGLAVVDAEVKARNLTVEQPPPTPPPLGGQRGGRDRDREQGR